MKKSYYICITLIFTLFVSCSAPQAKKEAPKPLEKKDIKISIDSGQTSQKPSLPTGRTLVGKEQIQQKPKVSAGITLAFVSATVTKPRRDNTYTQTLTKTEVTGDVGEISYKTSDPAIATVDNKGIVTFLKPEGGTVTITATKASTPNKYSESIATYKLIIDHPDGSTIDYAEESVQAVFRYPFTYTQALTKSRDVADDQGKITYASSDTAIATVDAAGVVTMKKINEEEVTTVRITATKAETPAKNYLQSSDSYTLTIMRFTPATKPELVAEIQEITKPTAQGMTADLNYIDTSAITTMSYLFSNHTTHGNGLSAFNGDISKWDVSKVANMHSMFAGATVFNGTLSEWKVGKVTNMHSMFLGAAAFNGDISKWDVSKVTDMRGMFRNAAVFNSHLSKWNVSKVVEMFGMFDGAAQFTRDLNCWADRINTVLKLNGGTIHNMFDNSGLRNNKPEWHSNTRATSPTDCPAVNPKDSAEDAS